MITQQRLKELLEYDPETGRFTWLVSGKRRKAGSHPKRYSGDGGYLRIRIDGRPYRGHHLAWLYMTGDFPPCDVDHRDLNRGNNAWRNLRLAPDNLNNVNNPKRKDNTSGFKGVSWCPARKKWRARIAIDGKTRTLGTYETAEAAHAAYTKVAVAAYGEFARVL